MRPVIAIARNLIVEIFRMRVLLAFIILIITSYTVFFWWWLAGNEGLADEKVKTFLSYSLSLCAHVLSFLTIFISIATIARDIKRKEIFTITTKPVSRIRYLLGKILGLLVLNLVLLGLSGFLIYGLARSLQRTEPTTAAERNRMRELVFVARKSVQPVMPDITQQVLEIVEARVKRKIKEQPEYYRHNPVVVKQMRETLIKDNTKRIINAQRTVEPGKSILWHFTGIEPLDREKGYVFIRFQQEVSGEPPDAKVINQWLLGPRNPLEHGGRYVEPQREAVRTVHEFPIPVTEVSPEGDLFVVYNNSTSNRGTTITFPLKTGMELLYVVGGFEGNFFRTILMIYLRLLFLSVLGLAAGAWMSFPVAVLFALVIFIMGLTSGFLIDALRMEAGEIQRSIAGTVLQILPQFSTYDPVPHIEKGRVVSSELVRQCLIFLILIKGGLIALAGYLIFRFRELARVIV